MSSDVGETVIKVVGVGGIAICIMFLMGGLFEEYKIKKDRDVLFNEIDNILQMQDRTESPLTVKKVVKKRDCIATLERFWPLADKVFVGDAMFINNHIEHPIIVKDSLFSRSRVISRFDKACDIGNEENITIKIIIEGDNANE